MRSYLYLALCLGFTCGAAAQDNPAAAAPIPIAPVVCDDTFMQATPGQVALTPAQHMAICAPANTWALDAAFKNVCPQLKAKFGEARARVCAVFPNLLPAGDYDFIARAYFAAGEPLAGALPASGGAAPPPERSLGVENTQAEALTAAVPVSIIAQGVGDFLTKRAEQEIGAYATVEVFERLCTKPEAGPDLPQWFPKTCTLLTTLDSGGEMLGLGTLRSTVIDDLEQLPRHALLEAFARVPLDQQQRACALDAAYALALGIKDLGAIKLLFELEPASEAEARPKLAFERYASPTLRAACEPVWSQLASEFDPRKPKSAGAVIQAYDAQITVSVKSARTAAEGVADNDKALSGVAQRYRVLAQALDDIRTGRDPQAASARAIRAAFALLKSAFGKGNYGEALDEIEVIAVAVVEGDYIGVVKGMATAEALGPILFGTSHSGFEAKLHSTLTLLADIATADSSEGVADAVGRFAEPIGSWRRKYERLTIGLNGYVGAKAAFEWVKNAQSGTSFAPVLALGLDVAGPLWSHGRLGAFLQLVDIGNVANVRVSSKGSATKVEVAPEIQALQVFAPGMYLTFAPWKAPFVLGLGGDFAPLLRSTADGRKSAWHLGATLAVDVPLLELVRP